MDNVKMTMNNSQYLLTILIEKNKVKDCVEAMREAAKILQREVLRYESDPNGCLYRKPDVH